MRFKMPLLEENGEPYRIKDQFHSQGSTIKVIQVGAGAAGLLTAYKMKKMFSDYELVCYEKYIRDQAEMLVQMLTTDQKSFSGRYLVSTPPRSHWV